ncbi:MAG: HAD-IIIC family phosphatase [Candidatus Krumholzibacteriia bacterium]
MANEPQHCLIMSDFNAANLAGYLSNESPPDTPPLAAACAPFGQVRSLLLGPVAPGGRERWDLLVVWTTPDGILEGFRRLLEGEDVATETLLEEVDAYADLVLRARDWAGHILVPTWALPGFHRGLGLLDWRPGLGLNERLARLNLRLAERLSAHPQVFVLDVGRWMLAAGRFASNPKLWHMAKIPYGHEVFQAAAADIHAARAGAQGRARKVLVLDLDDTVWGGIVGDVGWENLKVGGHDPVGEAYAAFQRELKALTRRGIVLGVVSKNDESVALTALRQHPEMVLSETDLAGWRINWNDKAANLAALVGDLNLGLQAVVFIDDNPAERARIRETFPEVLVPEWPADPLLYRKALLELRCFDTAAITADDRGRAGMYLTERQRRELQERVGSLQEWLASLEMRVTVEPLNPGNLARAAQLLNKVNQMNLSTRRLSETELDAWAAHPENALWTLRVADRFGDAGLTGMVGVHQEGDTLHLVDLVLSCRVFGREIEQQMLHLAVQEARLRGCGTLVAEYRPTAKNRPTLEFLERSGLDRDDDTLFRWPVSRQYPSPSHLLVEST